MLASVLAHPLGCNGFGCLGQHGHRVPVFVHTLGAVLHAQLHVQQAQEVVHLGGGAHRALAAATRQALLNGHGGRNAIHRVHLRAACGLHQRAGVGVERFQIAALAFVEQDVKRQGGLA